MAPDLHYLLFGDLNLDQWPPQGNPSNNSEPWKSFVDARNALSSGDKSRAVTLWKQIAQMQGIESRHTLQAWHFLRQNGEAPPTELHKRLLGVVLEVPVETGCDYLAVYPDGNARYINYTGAGTVWEHPNDSLDAEIGALLRAGQNILNHIGPWNQPRRGTPQAGGLRINLLSPAGLHFGEGPFEALAQDQMAKPIIDAGIALMQRLTSMGSGK